jgi:hypothetical protein
MSIYFVTKDGRDLWNPASLTARLFHNQAESVAKLIPSETGLGPIVSDEVILDEARFALFAKAFAGFILKMDRRSGAWALSENCFGMVAALAEKSGGAVFNDVELLPLVERGRRILR